MVEYLDDLLIYKKTVEEHVKHLELVSSRLNKKKIYISPGKFMFLQRRLRFLE